MQREAHEFWGRLMGYLLGEGGDIREKGGDVGKRGGNGG